MDTIFAVSSGAPPAAIAILRISGADAMVVARALIGGDLPAPRVATLRRLHSADGAVLDQALVLVFPGPDSATGEDVVELHLHGGRAVVAAVESTLLESKGLRRAEAGEFTRRALLAGRIDLSEAEGLGDLLSAETESQRRVAIASVEGAVRRQVGDWSARLLALAARVEAELDFSDEDDVAPENVKAIGESARQLAADIGSVLTNPPVERLRDGVRVVLAGPPNSGKSTLLNALVEREAAIVSPISGTTRDRIEVPVARGGIAYVLTDTAGLAEASDDPIERVGIARSHQAMAEADVVIWLGDERPSVQNVVWIRARADEPGRSAMVQGQELAISAHLGQGLDALWALIVDRSSGFLPKLDALVLNARQRDLAAECMAHIERAAGESDVLLVAEHLRLGLRALDRITGRSDVEAMLDTLFARFCIGK